MWRNSRIKRRSAVSDRSPLMELHQVLVSASPGDAITNEAFEIRELLRESGPSEIFARYIDPRLSEAVFPLPAYVEGRGNATQDDVIFFHASIGQAEVHSFLLDRAERLVLIYHNISPAKSFRSHDPEFAELLDQGRVELQSLAHRASVALADSAFNAGELEALGYRDVRVSPLIVDFDRLTSIEPAPGMVRHFEEHVDGPVVLFVGQLLPHKRPDLLIQAHHVLATYHIPESFLLLVGWARLPTYRAALQTLIEELNLTRAWISESVTDEEMAAFYRRADAFVTLSEHEGFCAPALEAMAFDLPVIARRRGAVPETMGDAGLLLPADDDPILAAEAIAEILTDAKLSSQLVARGRERLKDFDPEVSRATFRKHLAAIL